MAWPENNQPWLFKHFPHQKSTQHNISQSGLEGRAFVRVKTQKKKEGKTQKINKCKNIVLERALNSAQQN